ncbi:cupin [Stenotrophomonas maltophilia]|nr:cupin [Stenotrophomonas maltophilia]
MKQIAATTFPSKTISLLLAAALAATAAACSSSPSSQSPAIVLDDQAVSLPAQQLYWQDVPGTGGAVSYANTQGNILGNGSGFYSAFVRFKAGTDNGLHTHSQTLPTVVLSGTFYARIHGKEMLFPAGSFYNLPANKVHESGCKAGDDCLLFQYQANNFDLVPAKQ